MENIRELNNMENNEAVVMKKRFSIGRQRIDIKKIAKKSSLQTSFSKRKQGVFNKAAELSILTGADVAVIAKSPAGRKFFAFGSPSPDYVFNRFLNPSQNQNHTNVASNAELRQLINRNKELEAEREALARGEGMYWWEQDVSGLELSELEKYASALENLQKNVIGRAYDMTIQEYSTNFC